MRASRAQLKASLAAGLAFSAVSLGLRLVAPWPSYFDLAAERLVAALPGSAFDALLERLQHWGKPVLLVGLVLLAVCVLGVAGWAYALLARRGSWPRAFAQAGLLAVVLWALSGWLLAAGVQAMLVALPAFLSFAAVLLVAAQPPPRLHDLATNDGRRRLVFGLLGLGAMANAGVLWRLVADMVEPGAPLASGVKPALPSTKLDGSSATSDMFAALPGMTPEITDNDTFYRVSINFVDPRVTVDPWSLEIFGLVDQPQSLTYDQLRALPSVDEYVTLTCISNQVGGPLTGNALWTGAQLSTVLAAVKPKPEARYVVFRCSDNYTESYPLDKALAESTILAYQMNGHQLPQRHGFPLRVISTGRYGMKNPKWLHRIELVSSPTPGYWERQGWDPDVGVQTLSRIDSPAAGMPLASGSAALGGIAFAGERGIAKVEASVDGGQTWRAAVVEPARGPSAWNRWLLPWPDATPGRYKASVRATDKTGVLQQPSARPGFPAGATGYDEVEVVIQ